MKLNEQAVGSCVFAKAPFTVMEVSETQLPPVKLICVSPVPWKLIGGIAPLLMAAGTLVALPDPWNPMIPQS